MKLPEAWMQQADAYMEIAKMLGAESKTAQRRPRGVRTSRLDDPTHSDPQTKPSIIII